MRSELAAHRSFSRRASQWLSSLAVCTLLAGNAAAQVQVTSLEGTASTAGSPLALHAELADGLPVEVSTRGRCTLLLAQRTLVQLCGRTKATFVGVRGGNAGEIDLYAGDLKVVALARADAGALEIRTPSARVVLLGSGTHVSVSAKSGDTVVSALVSPVGVSVPTGADTEGGEAELRQVKVAPGQQLTVRRGEAPEETRAVSHDSLVRINACAKTGSDFAAALRADRALLAAALPAVSAGDGGVVAAPASDLQDIVREDFPAGGLPLVGTATPSALVTELNKRGMDEEVCDPITCNPVYQLDPPGRCGVPPERGCIP
jgi:hypothetical protein